MVGSLIITIKLKRKNKVGEITLLDFEIYLKVIEIKTMWHKLHINKMKQN